MEIEINNWDKYNTRKDIKNPSWFAVSNRILEDSDIYELTDKEFKAWIYCLSRASVQNEGGLTEIDTRHSLRVCGVEGKTIASMLEKLEKVESVKIIESHVQAPNASVRTEQSHVRAPSNLHPNITNITNITDKTYKRPPKENLIDENFKSDFTHEYLKQVGIKTQKAWFEAYPDVEFVLEEINKASIYLTNNPGKYSKIGAFFSSWLSRSWEKLRDSKKEVSAKKSEQQMAVSQLEELAAQALADYQENQMVQNA